MADHNSTFDESRLANVVNIKRRWSFLKPRSCVAKKKHIEAISRGKNMSIYMSNIFKNRIEETFFPTKIKNDN